MTKPWEQSDAYRAIEPPPIFTGVLPSAAWFYSRGGDRLGPYTVTQMRSFFGQGTITAATLCWSSELGSAWQKYSDTALYRNDAARSAPPPLPLSEINNTFAILFALVPLIGAIIELVVIGYLPKQPNTVAVAAPYVLVYGILAGLDGTMLKRSGHVPSGNLPSTWWFLIAPVYLLARAKALHQKQWLFLVWLITFGAAIAVQQPDIANRLRLSVNSGIPASCDSTYAINEAKSVFDTIPLLKLSGITAIRVDNPVSVSSSPTSLVCRGRVETSSDTNVAVRYSFTEENDQVMVRVHIED